MVAAATGYRNPAQQLMTALPSVGKIAAEIVAETAADESGVDSDGGWDEDGWKKRTARLNPTGAGFPNTAELGTLYGSDAWMIEAVYVADTHRRQGLGERVTLAAAGAGDDEGLEACGVVVAVGNDGARRLYERAGFTHIGTGDNSECNAAVGVPGFTVLKAQLDDLVARHKAAEANWSGL